MIKLTINNRPVEADDGTTVAAAVYQSGTDVFRRSVTGEARGPVCGMGICFECRVTIDGVQHERSCNVLVRDGMEVVTDA
ncbi:MAG TPA: (2Fe-2S)-binding protein [Pyrinomonadaceae bacterium]|nr:(2Fe-2S)-binding protein [Pyrinomonadaceae bacterium]